jgi:tryptophanyl-tRNA synthetase
MSKSLDNHIELAATPEETRQRVMQMVTDPARIRRSDPGNPDVCNVFSMHKVFSSPEEVARVNVECRQAGIGCVDCKALFVNNLNNHLVPFRLKRAELGKDPNLVWEVLKQGKERASKIARQTMAEVREAVGLP